MTYALPQDMIDRFGEVEMIQLTDRSNTLHQVDGAVLAAALDDARGEIDGYLGAVYRLPLKTVPRILNAQACDIARYRLYDERATEQVTKRYDDALKFLKLVAERKVMLGAEVQDAVIAVNGDGQVPTPGVGPVHFGGDRTFGPGQLQDYLS